MAPEQWEITSRIWHSIFVHQESRLGPGEGRWFRLLKLSEEIGEVSSAAVGYVGGNKRKGVTHAPRDIASELADVIITAMVALEDWTPDAETFFANHLAGVRERVQRDGS